MTLAMTFKDRLILAREEMDNITQADLAEAIGVSQSTVATWERGKPGERGKNEPDLATIQRIAKELNKTPEWLAFGVQEEAMFSALRLVPEVDARAMAGPGGLMEVLQGSENVVRRYGFPKEEFRALFGPKPDGVVILEVIGDSMIPTLNAGERVFVNTNDVAATPPGIFVVWDGSGLVLKRVEFIAHSDPPRVRISSDNGRYEPYVRLVEEAYIQGRVIGSLQRR